MGLRLDWIAVRGSDETALLDQFDLTPYGHVSEEVSTKFALGKLANGWLILTMERTHLAEDGPIANLARAYDEMLAARVIENVMYCRVQAYAGGARSWDVVYDCEKARDDVVVQGSPPRELETIMERCAAEQAKSSEAAYFFDAPTDLAKAVCGYGVGENDDVEWRRLIKVSARRKLPDEPRSMPEAIRSELRPFLESLGWKVKPQSLMNRPEHVTRKVGPFTQSIGLWFISGEETDLCVRFREVDTRSKGQAYFFFADILPEPDRRPAWKRWLGLDKPPKPDDPVAAAIAGAREDILRAERYLKDRIEDDRVYVDWCEGKRDDVAAAD